MPRTELRPGVVETQYWHRLDDGRVQCDLCPRFCKLNDGQRGFCFVRQREGEGIVLTAYGRSSGFCIDPIEKKPLFHFLPGTPVLSFGTAGCNLGCKFCQNWDMSKSREVSTLSETASPERIANAAVEAGCSSIAFTYNDPVIFHEYAIDAALAAHERGLKTVAVTAGEVCSEPRSEFYRTIDAANVDLKAFSQTFYHEVCAAKLEPVLETLAYIKHETNVWLEITTLLIPGLNDSDSELDRMTAWIAGTLGTETPLHFSAFHPDFRLRDIPATPVATLLRARQHALANGLRHAYVGNVSAVEACTTYCTGCQQPLIKRDRFRVTQYELGPSGSCPSCGKTCAGVWGDGAGCWGSRRVRVAFDESR